MASSALFGVLAATLVAGLPVGSELQYSGKLERNEGTTGAADKTFTLVVTATEPGSLSFLVDERGGGGWNWPQRYGRITLDDEKSTAIRLLHLFEGTPTPLPVRRPVFEFVDRLMPDSEWFVGGTQYAHTRNRTVNGREVAIVEVSLDRGRRQVLQVEPSTGLLVSLDERLFMGRGDAFRLTMQLEGVRTLEAGELEEALKITKALNDLQAELSPPDSQHRAQFDAAQLSKAQQVVASLMPVNETVWGRFVTTIQRDLAVQSRRLEGVAGLEQKFVGQAASTDAPWKRIDGTPFPSEEREGHTTVLHFWEYGGEKLLEPYGQVGYLDFLSQRRGKLGAHVIGVAVDSRFADPAQARAAARSIRKFQEFMNVSFPLVADDGALLAKYGDPRSLGSELPLWVVIGHDGKISHYKVGYYDLQPDEGLRELDAAVVEALKKEKAAARGQ